MMSTGFEIKDKFISGITQNLEEISLALYHKTLSYELTDIENFINHKDYNILYLANTEKNGMY